MTQAIMSNIKIAIDARMPHRDIATIALCFAEYVKDRIVR